MRWKTIVDRAWAAIGLIFIVWILAYLLIWVPLNLLGSPLVSHDTQSLPWYEDQRYCRGYRQECEEGGREAQDEEWRDN